MAALTGLAAYPYSTGALLTWSAYSGATSYDYRVNGGAPTTGLTSNQVTVTGLTNGTTYSVDVRAVTSAGAQDWTNVSVTTATALLFDNFDRADVAPSSTALGSAVEGGSYTQSGALGISSGMCYATTQQHNVAYVGGAYNVDATLQTSGSQSNNNGVGIVFRAASATTMWYYQLTTSTVGLYRRTSGTEALWVAPTYGPPSSTLLRVYAYNEVVLCYVNGVLRFSTIDDVSASGDAGLGVRSFATAGRSDWVHARPSTALAVAPGYAYKGRDAKSLDTTGAS